MMFVEAITFDKPKEKLKESKRMSKVEDSFTF